MNKTGKQIKFAGLALALSAFIVGAFAVAPASTTTPKEQVTVTGDVTLKRKADSCVVDCLALVDINGYEVFVEYGMDGDSIHYLEPMSVSKNGVEVDAYIDRAEIEKINASIVGGGK